VVNRFSNYRGISLLSTRYKTLSNILLSRLTPYAEEIIGGSSMWILTQQVNFCIFQIIKKKWEYNEVVDQPFIDFKKSYDTFRRDVLCNIVIEFGSHETGKTDKNVSE
jgi:hypothetical protein